jgi:tetratricopeptide (TPR) repeat protein
MNNENMTSQIEQYLDQELSISEVEKFENMLKSNKQLLRELTLHKAIRKALAENDVINLRQNLRKIAARNKLKTLPVKKKVLYAISASTIIMMLILVFILTQRETSEKVYAEYYRKYESGISFRGEDRGEGSTFKLAILRYNESQYEESIKLLNQISINDNNYIAARYFIGLSCIEQNKHKAAILYFNEVMKNSKSIFYDNAAWYCAMCYLKNNNKTEAIIVLKRINNENSLYKNQAEEIINRLK